MPPPTASPSHPGSAASQQVPPTTARRRLEGMFRQHHALIWRTLRRLGSSPESAADFTQQAYLIAAERIEAIRPGCERAFLFSTAVRLSRTSYRKQKRLELVEDVDAHRTWPSENLEHERASQRQRAQRLLDTILGELDPELVTVFVLYELEGLSTREIAELHEIPLGTAASRLRRAREAFRNCAARAEGAGKGMIT